MITIIKIKDTVHMVDLGLRRKVGRDGPGIEVFAFQMFIAKIDAKICCWKGKI